MSLEVVPNTFLMKNAHFEQRVIIRLYAYNQHQQVYGTWLGKSYTAKREDPRPNEKVFLPNTAKCHGRHASSPFPSSSLFFLPLLSSLANTLPIKDI
jgi:hypothetical protein